MAALYLFLIAAFFWLSLCNAATIEHWFNVTWVMANPDGLLEREVIGINGSWPLPVIEVNKGDQLIVHMHNGLGDKSTSMHFHGMFQNGTAEMDGPNMVSQCPVVPGQEFTYNFTVNQNGTYWYHCHVDFCYPDGYRQALIVHDADAWFANDYAEEFAVTVSDWYHEITQEIKADFISEYNPTGAEPIPKSFLFNDTLDTSIPVQPNTTYLLRIINTGAFVAQYFYIEDHNFTIVEVDGVYTEPQEADLLYIAVAQRYSILITTKDTADKNYAIVTVADQVLLDVVPDNLKLNLTNWLEYDASAAHEQAVVSLDVVDSNPAYDDFDLVPYDKTPLFANPDRVINLTVTMGILGNGKPYAFLNDITYTIPKVPVLYSALSAGDQAVESEVYGGYTNAFVLNQFDVVEVILNNDDTGTHPFHLHGHNFQVVDRYPAYGANFYSQTDDTDPVDFNASKDNTYPTYPIRRDVAVLPPMGNMVIRFVADNPGVWFFHCHIDWHLSQGLASVFIEAPLALQKKVTIPEDHLAACQAADIPTAGNAAGNTEDYLDLTGQNVQYAPDPYGGFTAKGYVAMAFSVLSAILGMIGLGIYGMSDAKYVERDPSLEETTHGSVNESAESATQEVIETK